MAAETYCDILMRVKEEIEGTVQLFSVSGSE